MNVNRSHSTRKVNLAVWLAIAAMLPTLGIGIWLFGKLFHDLWGYTALNDLSAWTWNEVLSPEIGWVVSWLAPFLLGVVVAGFILRKRKTTPGIVSGIVTICASYLVLCWNQGRIVDECSRTQYMCGEWSFLNYALYFVMCAVNSLALAAFIFLVNKIQVRRKSKK